MMNLKINELLILFLIISGVFFQSCSDNLSEDNGINTSSSAFKAGYMSLSLSYPSGNTKIKRLSVNSGNSEDWQINSLRLIFYNQEKVYKYFDLDIKIKGGVISGNDVLNPGSISPNADQIVLFAFKPLYLLMQDYQVVALANPPQAVKDITTEGMHLSLLTDGIANLNSVYDLITADGKQSGENNNFYMANVSGPIVCSSDDFYNNYQDAVNDPRGKRLKFMIERGVAKVFFTTDLQAKQDLTDKGTTYNLDLSKIEWTVDVTNRKFYWLRHLTYKRGGEDFNLPFKNLEQHNDYILNNGSERMNLYAQDPNFNKIEADDALKDNFMYINASTVQWKAYNQGGDNFTYVPENTMAKDNFKMNASTQIVLRVPYAISPSTTYDKYMYYRIPIRHFLKTEVQDVVGDNDSEGGPGGSEEGEGGFVGSAQFWGAYGVVRNNVYHINLKSINKIGSLEYKDADNSVNVY